MRRPCTKKDAPAEWRWIWRKYLQAQECGQNYVETPLEARVVPSYTSKYPEERECVVDSGASMHMMSKNILKLR